MRRLLLALPFLAALSLAACTESGPVAPDIETANFAASLGVDLANSTKTSTGLYYRDITVGSGATVPATGVVSLTNAYVGYLRSGLEFDSGTFTFNTGTGAVIPGYDEGVRGMRVGGVRQGIIPPHLGYGSSGTGGIPGNSILVFNITLNSIN